jgi:hypothetical protein
MAESIWAKRTLVCDLCRAEAEVRPLPQHRLDLLRRGHGRPGRARSHCRFVPPLIHFIPDLLTYSVPLFLKQQCDRTLRPGRIRGLQGRGERLALGESAIKCRPPLNVLDAIHTIIAAIEHVQMNISFL